MFPSCGSCTFSVLVFFQCVSGGDHCHVPVKDVNNKLRGAEVCLSCVRARSEKDSATEHVINSWVGTEPHWLEQRGLAAGCKWTSEQGACLRPGTMQICACVCVLLLLGLSVFEPVEGRRTRFKPKKKDKKIEKPAEEISPAMDIDINQVPDLSN